MKAKEILELIVKAADSKKAENVFALDIGKLSVISDYFLLASAPSSRQVQAIANEIIDEMHKNNISPFEVEGLSSGKWVLIDYGSVVAHIFTDEAFDYYKLDHLWSRADRVDLSKWLTADFD